MVGVQQPRSRGDDAVPIGVRVIGEGNPVVVLEADEPGHCVRAGAVHADGAVVIDGHERKGRIDLRIDDSDVQPVYRIDRFPVMDGGAAERVDREGQSSGANGVHVDNVAQVFDIGEYEIFLLRRFRADRSLECRPLYAGIAIPQQLVGPTLDPLGRVSIGRPAIRRVVFEAAILGRVVEGVTTMPSAVDPCASGCESGWRARRLALA
jgi:hypothetical protein